MRTGSRSGCLRLCPKRFPFGRHRGTSSSLDVNTPEKAKEFVIRQKEQGYDALNMYGDGFGTMDSTTYFTLAKTVIENNIRLVGHAPRSLPFEIVLKAGQNSIDHIEEIVYTETRFKKIYGPLHEYQFGTKDSTAISAISVYLDRFPKNAPELLEAEIRSLGNEIKENGLVLTPTLVTFKTILDQTNDEYFLSFLFFG